MWIFDNVAPVEVWWTTQNLIGAGIALFLCTDVIMDAKSSLLMAEKGRKSATMLCLAIISSMILAMIIYAVIGFVAMTQPSVGSDGVSPTQWAAIIGFGVSSTIKVAICVAWRIMRFRLRREGVDPSLAIGKATSA